MACNCIDVFVSLVVNMLMESCEGVKNEPPPNVPLWHVDYFEVKSINTSKTQDELSTSPLTEEKNSDRRHGLKRELSPDITTKSLC